jgi:hypothetical protein
MDLHPTERLQHRYPVAFCITTGQVKSHSRYFHRFAKWLTARFFNFLDVFLDILYRDNDRGILVWFVVRLLKETAVDTAASTFATISALKSRASIALSESAV